MTGSMGASLLEVVLLRAGLVALPFGLWFVWREVARRTGRPMGSTPWAWLFAVGAILMGLSLMTTVFLHPDNRGSTYIPAEAAADGHIDPGYFKKSGTP